MAKPIKETPILKGNDAKDFNKRMQASASISKQENDRRQENFNKLNSIVKF